MFNIITGFQDIEKAWTPIPKTLFITVSCWGWGLYTKNYGKIQVDYKMQVTLLRREGRRLCD